MTRQTLAAIESGQQSPGLPCALRRAESFGKPLEEIVHWAA